MGKTVFLFSGQGSQYAGMGAELCAALPEAKKIYDLASDTLGFDVLKLSREGSDAELAKTGVSQPLIFTLSLAAFSAASAAGLRADACAGFSLGECTALTASGAMSPETGFKVIRERAKAMQRAAEEKGGTMYAILGASAQDVEEACAKAGGYAAPVNFNCPGQIVIAGEEAAATSSAQTLAASGAKTVRLAVNAAFHSRMMDGAAQDFYAVIKDMPFGRPSMTLYSNVSGEKYETDDIPSYLRRQMVSPVRFTDEMAAMEKDSCDTFVEFGPGKTLCGFIRRGIRGARSMSVDNPAALEKCLETLLK
jgi:[acyl-carrier-protein] S-malonyltransferase